MIAVAATSMIASVILLGSVGMAIWQCVARSGDYPWYGRVGLTIVVAVVVSGVVGRVLDAVGLDINDEVDAAAELRDELSASGYTPAEIDCVETALIREHGSVEAIVDADDITPSFIAMMACKGDTGMDAAMMECWAAELVVHFDIDRFDADAMSDVADAMSEPEHRRFATVTSLTCQGLPQEGAECIYETVTAAHPEILGNTTPGLTPEQQGWILDAGRECGVS